MLLIMSANIELSQGVTMIRDESETLILERVDDVVHATLEPVYVLNYNAGSAVTGIKHAANYLGVHPNTIRRYVDAGLLKAEKLPTGVRRIE
jgi:hypothetical protein